MRSRHAIKSGAVAYCTSGEDLRGQTPLFVLLHQRGGLKGSDPFVCSE